MRDETVEPRDPNHIWLRQSVTFTVNGQTRTVEMALPLRPGATPGEVEALLDEADAGMRRLSRRLDAHLAELAGSPAAAPTPPASAAAPPVRSAPERPSAAPRPQQVPAAPPAPPAGPDLTIPEFIAQAAAIGFDSRRAMEKLNVRSLSNLNLRVSLETLRRQALLDGTSPEPASAPAAPPLAFEEEEDSATLAAEPEMELSYPDPASLPDGEEEDDLLTGDDIAGAATAPAASPPSGPLADVPDLSALRRDARLTPASKLPAPATRRSGPLAADGAIAETPAAPLAPPPPPVPKEAPGSRAERIIAELRAAHPGGAPGAHQRTAFQNLVVGQLDETRAAALAKLVWNLTPAELGPEQYDALIRWGKRDDFVEEVREVVAVIRAARKAAQPPAPEAETPPATPPARAARPARPRSAPPTQERQGEP